MQPDIFLKVKIRIKTPTKAFIDEASPDEMDKLRKLLSYTNTAAQHMVKRHYNNHWLKSKDSRAWGEHLEVLKKGVYNTLVFEEDGKPYIRPGSTPYLEEDPSLLVEISNEVVYPTPKKVPWAKPLPFNLYEYQEDSWQKLLAEKHGSISLATGSGKSGVILKLCREMGLRTIVIAPSKGIFLELLQKFEHHFGKGSVGAFGNGRKNIGKKFTICINDSLVNVKQGSPEWEFFSASECMIIDESHTFSSETLEEVCHGVCADIPYRLFLSATQTRGDGSLKLLQSIIGKTVHSLTTKEAVDGGYICPHDYRIVSLESSNPNFQSSDVLEQKREHLLRNRNICAFIAKLAKVEATTHRRQTLVLVEELGQIAALLPLLKADNIPTAIAHSETKPARLAELRLEKVDVAESIEKFNKGEALVLIATSCAHVGVNIFPTHNCVWWVGGSSEIRVRQGAIGRAIRLGSHNPWADKCAPKPRATIWDFNVYDVYAMERHLEDRLRFYLDSGSEIKYIKLK